MNLWILESEWMPSGGVTPGMGPHDFGVGWTQPSTPKDMTHSISIRVLSFFLSGRPMLTL